VIGRRRRDMGVREGGWLEEGDEYYYCVVAGIDSKEWCYHGNSNIAVEGW